MKKGFSALLCIFAAGLLALAVYLSVDASARMRAEREAKAAEEAALALQKEQEEAGEPILYQVSAEYLSACFSEWIGEILPAEAETDWMLDAALRSCINNGYVHAAQRNGTEVQAIYAHEVEFALQRLFRQSVAHQSLPLVEYNAATGEYFLSPYLEFVHPVNAVVYDVQQLEDDSYGVKAELKRGFGYSVQGEYSMGDLGSCQVYSVISVDGGGAKIESIQLLQNEAVYDADIAGQLVNDAAGWFVMAQDGETPPEESARLLLYRLTGGIAPPSFTNIATQAGEQWLLDGLLGLVSSRYYNRGAAYWDARCTDIFDFAAYEAAYNMPLVAAEDMDALARELYGIGSLDYSVLTRESSLPFAFDENTSFYTGRGASGAARELYVWPVEFENDTLCIVRATYFTVAYHDEEYYVGVAGYDGSLDEVVWNETYWEWSDTWLENVLQTYPERFVTVEYTLEQRDGMWLPVAAHRQ